MFPYEICDTGNVFFGPGIEMIIGKWYLNFTNEKGTHFY